jgi:carboxymethylenebutenolidase
MIAITHLSDGSCRMPETTITVPDGSFFAHVARPAAIPAGSVVVIQEIFGVNAAMRAACDWIASLGFIAICPDLFWRIEPRIDITDKSQAEWDKAFALFKAFDQDAGVADLKATLAAARTLPGANGRAGTIGFCLGGRLAFMMAARSDADVSVSYYGVGLEGLLGEVDAIRAPLLLHIAAEDKFVPKEAQAAILAGVAGRANVAAHVYQGADHAFARVDGIHYDAAAAALANGRTEALLRKALA